MNLLRIPFKVPLVLALMVAYVLHCVHPVLPIHQYGIALVKAMPVGMLGMLHFGVRPKLCMGLLLSAVGDFCLDMDQKFPHLFLVGLCSFACAHACYALDFLQHATEGMCRTRPSQFVFLGSIPVIGGLLLMYLLPAVQAKEPGLAIPVVGYVAIIDFMLVSAWAGRESSQDRQAAIVGSLLFAVSDTILAIDKFAQPIPNAKLAVMLTYYSAQLYIAHSRPYGGTAAKKMGGRVERSSSTKRE